MRRTSRDRPHGLDLRGRHHVPRPRRRRGVARCHRGSLGAREPVARDLQREQPRAPRRFPRHDAIGRAHEGDRYAARFPGWLAPILIAHREAPRVTRQASSRSCCTSTPGLCTKSTSLDPKRGAGERIRNRTPFPSTCTVRSLRLDERATSPAILACSASTVFAGCKMGAVSVARIIAPSGIVRSACARRSAATRCTTRSKRRPSRAKVVPRASAIMTASRFSGGSIPVLRAPWHHESSYGLPRRLPP